MSSIEHYLRLRFDRRDVDALKSSYQGPKKLKKSGKAASDKKRKDKVEKKPKIKIKQRHRDKKNLGKRRKPSADPQEISSEDGTSPMKKRS